MLITWILILVCLARLLVMTPPLLSPPPPNNNTQTRVVPLVLSFPVLAQLSGQGMIKYNCGGMGLTTGLRQQVQRLVEVLAIAEQLVHVQVNLRDWNKNGEGGHAAQMVLEPFSALANVRGAVVVTGDVEAGFAEDLRCAMEARRGLVVSPALVM